MFLSFFYFFLSPALLFFHCLLVREGTKKLVSKNIFEVRSETIVVSRDTMRFAFKLISRDFKHSRWTDQAYLGLM
jgi:hypothetical protein